MVTDPYEILGVSKDATQDEIKKAYRQKAKQYHPDLHPGDEAAARKMNDVNEAYDMLMNPGKYANRNQQQARSQQQSSYDRQGSSSGQQQGDPYGWYQGPGGWASDFGFEDIFGFGSPFGGAQNHHPQAEQGDDPAIRQIIDDINSGRYQSAVSRLSEIPSGGRTARWYYLSGLAHHGLGNTLQAVEQMQRAVQLDPNNQTYRRLLQQYRQAGQTYQQTSGEYATGQKTVQRVCIGLCLADLFCSFCVRC